MLWIMTDWASLGCKKTMDLDFSGGGELNGSDVG